MTWEALTRRPRWRRLSWRRRSQSSVAVGPALLISLVTLLTALFLTVAHPVTAQVSTVKSQVAQRKDAAVEGETAPQPDSAAICAALPDGTVLRLQPARIPPACSLWSFALEGPQAWKVEKATLSWENSSVVAWQIAWPTPQLTLVDLAYPPLLGFRSMRLTVEGNDLEPVTFPLRTRGGPCLQRKRDNWSEARIVVRPNVIKYPVGQKTATLGELAGSDMSFLNLLRALDVAAVRKAVYKYAEGDTIQWSPERGTITYSGDVLRTYILIFGQGHVAGALCSVLERDPRVEEAAPAGSHSTWRQ